MNALEVQLPQDISIEEARLLLMIRTYALTEIESYEVNEQRIEEDFQ